MLGMAKGSAQNALERLFPKLKEATHMSQRAFSLARQNVEWEAFRELFQGSAQGGCHETLADIRGYLLMAVDGSLLPFRRTRHCGGIAARPDMS
jgi:hypothetical protein